MVAPQIGIAEASEKRGKFPPHILFSLRVSLRKNAIFRDNYMDECPNLFLIGAAKGGSSSFAFHLTDHPDIAFISEKEPNFFNQETVEICRQRLHDKAHLVPDTRYVLDASVNYSQYPKFKGVPQHIADICGLEAPRFLYMMRNPVERAISQYFWRQERYGEERSIEEAITPGSQYVLSSCYDLQIEQYLAVFPAEHFRFMIFERYYADVAGEYAATCRWLGISDTHQPNATRVKGATNKQFSRQSRFPALNRFVRSSNTARRLVKSLLPHKRQLQLTQALSKKAPREEVSLQTRTHLARLFAESIARTETLTGQDLSAWKTGQNVPA